MRRDLIRARPRQWFVIVLILAIGLSAYGCKDSVSISDEVQIPLSSLTVTPGALQPAFFSNTTNYKVDTPTSATSITVTAAPKDSTTAMTINGVSIGAGQRFPVTLGSPGSITIVTIVLEAQNGGESTYTINVTRLLSSNNNLSALSVTPGTLTPSPFNADTLDYTMDVATNVENVTVSATKSDPTAMMLVESVLINPMTVPGGIPSSGPVNIPLTGPGTNTVVSITVTAPNGEAKIYSITVHRAELSSNNKLKDLTVALSALDPNLINNFDENTTSYTVNVATGVTEVTVGATKSDPNAVLSGSVLDPGTGVATGQATITLSGAGTPTSISVTVTAQNTVDFKTYTITVNRAASNDDNLSALSLTADTVPLDLTPRFEQDHLDYTVEVAFGVTNVTVFATKSDPNAVLSGSVADPGSGHATGQAIITFILLPPPQVSITITAPNGDSKTYTVTVNQALAPPPSP